MNGFNCITNLEGKLKATISLISREKNAGFWFMKVKLFYDNEPAGVTSFNLRGYSQEEAEDIAKNLGGNAYLMQQIDRYLCGMED